MSDSIEIKVPDIGGATDVEVIEILVKAGEAIEANTSLLTLETDKASMELPAPRAGVIDSILVKVGDKVKEGSAIMTFRADSKETKKETPKEAAQTPKAEPEEKSAVAMDPEPRPTDQIIAASPSVRKIARELGVELAEVNGSGRKGRVSKEDIQGYVKSRLQGKSTSGPFALPEAPFIDFSQFGKTETKPLNKIKRLTGEQVHRSWISIPHVTQFDEADISDLEDFRKAENATAKPTDCKYTILAFVVKAVSKALIVYPEFNASLDPHSENLIYKHYINIGIAVETPNGLMVPVVKGANQLSVYEIAEVMSRLSKSAREKNINPADLNGGTFSISSLGGIGGTAFTPIVKSPEVAILGLSRAVIKPVYMAGEFKPRLMLPLSLSYDHRVIDGAEAARFTSYLVQLLSDIRKIIL